MPLKPSKKKSIPKSKGKDVKLKIKKASVLKAPLFDISGKSLGEIILPKDIFQVKQNTALLTQAIRVYQARKFTHHASTKTRAEVRGGGKKPWRQKGTGRARAGSIRSPLWVGGGVVFGPKPKKSEPILTKKMKKRALFNALSFKNSNASIKVISNFEKMEPRTKQAQKLLDELAISGKTLIILDDASKNVILATRNIPNIAVDLLPNLNAYEIISHSNLLFSKSAIEKLK